MTGPKTNERPGTRAVLRHSRTSAYKVRQVLDLIRGQDADRAAQILALADREVAATVGKVLASAVANAVHNDGQYAEDLYVSACFADEGSTLKRWRPRARGRATRIRKRTSHITVIVSRLPDERIARRRAKQTAAGAQRSRRVAGSRRRRQSETEPVPSTAAPIGDDTGAGAWPEDATRADDLVTETEAGPLEESDLAADWAPADGDDTDGTDADETDADIGASEHTPDADDVIDGPGSEEVTGDPAEEKGE